MKEFRYIDIDAGELIRNLGRLGSLGELARPIEGSEIGHLLSKNSVRAVWKNSGGLSTDIPSMLLGSESVFSDLLPRLLALPGGVMPVTSLMNAWLIEDFRESQIFDERPLSSTAVLGFVGLIVGELKATIGPNADLRLIGMDSVRRTLSFVCARAVMRGWRHESLAIIVERWIEAGVLTANEVNISTLGPVANVSGFLQSLSDIGEFEEHSPHVLAHQVQSWAEAQNGLNQRDLLQHSIPQLMRTLMGVSSREKRFDAIMEAINQSKSLEKKLHPLEHGFLISLIEPGSFEFLELAKQADPNGNSVATAYCAFAAILGGTAMLSKFNGFGWIVFNHGLRTGIDMPMDISFAELQILHDERRNAPVPFRTRSPSLVDVELAPMVTGSFGNATRRRVSSPKVAEVPDATEREELLRESLGTALRAVEDAYSVLQGKKPRQDRKTGLQRRLSK